MAESQFYTTKEVASLLGVTRKTLLKYQTSNKDFPAPVKLASNYFKYRKAEVDAFVFSALKSNSGECKGGL